MGGREPNDDFVSTAGAACGNDRHFAGGAGSGGRGARQRIACGWQATPILEQSGGRPPGSRAQMTQSSVQRVQFGWS